jgi:selenocysteine lyase/cysteine desulfurase
VTAAVQVSPNAVSLNATPLNAVLPDPAHAPAPPVVGADLRVPLVTGGEVPYANLDYAASAPALAAVRDAVEEFLPWYSSVHRGAGFASQVATTAYEQARREVAAFVHAPYGASVIFTRHTTDAMNLLAHCLPAGTTVLVFDSEHHATLLPWSYGQRHARRQDGRVVRLGYPASPQDAVDRLDTALRRLPVGPRLVAVTGASNVTGERWPIADLAEVAHEHGARIALDAAQLAPHHPIDITALDVDYVALSGHKLYAPYGVGALVGRSDWLRLAPPYLVGGGATRQVDDTRVSWAETPDRHEAGSPNVVGAVALAAACRTLRIAGLDALAAREQRLLARLRSGLAALGGGGVRELALWADGHPRVGIAAFTVRGLDDGLVATALAAEHGIGVRHGRFCAHPLVRRLTGGESGALRASLGLGTTEEHVDRLLAGLDALLSHGPRWNYRLRDGQLAPDPDPRPLPGFLAGPAAR